MRTFHIRRVIAAIVAIAACASAHAWGPDGHQTVGKLADELIAGTHAEKQVKAILHMSLEQASVCGVGLRHSNGAGAARAFGRIHHDDLHACAQSRWTWGAQSVGSVTAKAAVTPMCGSISFTGNASGDAKSASCNHRSENCPLAPLVSGMRSSSTAGPAGPINKGLVNALVPLPLKPSRLCAAYSRFV